jgi:hypothetical protein
VKARIETEKKMEHLPILGRERRRGGEEEFVVADKDLLNTSLEFDFPLCTLVVHSSPQRESAY